MKKFPFKSSFSFCVKPAIHTEVDKNLAIASLKEVGAFIPEVDSANIDLLPVAFNACVVNRVNKNDDVIDTQTALAVYKNFVNKPINVEHDRKRVIGSILKAGFSKFGTDEPMTEEEAMACNEPFNITLGGIIWKTVNQELAKYIEESADPTSENYLKVSASWELGFTENQIVLLDPDQKNLAGATIISDPEQVAKLEPLLRVNGGKQNFEGKKIYRKCAGEVLPLGIGFTENPAADVSGIASKASKAEESKAEDIEAELKQIEAEIQQLEEKNSQSSLLNVITNRVKNMKIQSLKDITDESLKVVSASAISDFLAEELKKASTEFEKEKGQVANDLTAAKDAHANLLKEHEELKTKLSELEDKLSTFAQEKASREKQEAFNERMAYFDETFELEAEERQLIASDITDLSEETFAGYKKKMDVLLKNKKKAAKKPAPKKGEHCDDEMSEEENTASKKEIVANALDNAKKEGVKIPNSQSAASDLSEKLKKAFEFDQFEVSV